MLLNIQLCKQTSFFLFSSYTLAQKNVISKTAAYSYFNKLSLMMAEFEFKSSRPWLAMVDTNFKSIFLYLSILFFSFEKFQDKIFISFRYFAISLFRWLSLAVQKRQLKKVTGDNWQCCTLSLWNISVSISFRHSQSK